MTLQDIVKQEIREVWRHLDEAEYALLLCQIRPHLKDMPQDQIPEEFEEVVRLFVNHQLNEYSKIR